MRLLQRVTLPSLVIAAIFLLSAIESPALEVQVDPEPAVKQKDEKADEDKTAEENETETGDQPAEEKQPEETIYDIRQRVEKARKDRYDILRLLGYIYSNTEENEKAIDAYRKASEMEPSDRETTDLLIGLYRKTEKWDQMIPMYERFIDKYKGDNAKYYNELVELYLKNKQDEKAFETLERFTGEHGDKVDTYIQVIEKFQEHANAARALEIMEKGLEKFPNNFTLNRRAAVAYMKNKDYSNAIAHFDAAKRLAESPNVKEEIEAEMAPLYENPEIVKEIIQKKTKELEKIDLELKELYTKQADLKEKAGKLDEALQAYKKLSALAPETAEGRMAAKKVKELEKKLEKE